MPGRPARREDAKAWLRSAASAETEVAPPPAPPPPPPPPMLPTAPLRLARQTSYSLARGRSRLVRLRASTTIGGERTHASATISCSGGGEPSYSPDGRHCTPPGSTAAEPPCPARAATASGCVAGAKTPTTRWKGRLSQFHEVNWNLSEEKVAVPDRPSCCWQRPSSPGLSRSGAPVSSESRSVPAHTATWIAGSSSAPTGWPLAVTRTWMRGRDHLRCHSHSHCAKAVARARSGMSSSTSRRTAGQTEGSRSWCPYVSPAGSRLGHSVHVHGPAGGISSSALRGARRKSSSPPPARSA
mmetsp:Transcript_17642/g.44046  ORF Transcript_17642/g.44046 Transcript_17642/m.44046 type:complete len:299 (+) Transcript_17642:117-1013(+)